MEKYTLFIFALTSFVPLVILACDFPDYMQSRRGGPEREWHVQQFEYHRGRQHLFTHVITFTSSTLNAEIKGKEKVGVVPDQPAGYKRRCVLEIEPGQYLVTHNDNNGSVQRYMCIQFIKRSDKVVQVKQSKLSHVQDPRLCAEQNMQLSHWPLIEKANLFSSYEQCPLDGGFNARFKDKNTRTGYCDVYEGETMIESECMKGEGIFFRFRYDNCIPKGLHMRADQQLFCMANWEHEHYRFIVLRHDTADRQWCFRYPKRGINQFNAVLFSEMVCDPEPNQEGVNEFLTISMSRADTQTSFDLCRDDHQGCSYWSSPCSQPGDNLHMTCARMCNLCNDTYPGSCTFPRNLWGEWLETNKYGHDIVDIKETTLTKYNYEGFQCIQWTNKKTEKDDKLREEMLVSTFDNGCKARYTCAQFKMHSPSVLHYKLSQSKVWPFYGTDWSNIDCSSFHYKDSHKPSGDLHHSRHLKVLISMDAITNVNCDLDEPLDFSVIMDNGITCHGMLTVKDSTVYKDQRLQLLLYDCPDKKPLQEFTCLDSHRHGYLSRQMIITESADNTNEYQCWFFPVSPEHTFYQLPMQHCNEGSAERIKKGQLVPLSKFLIKVRSTTTTTTTTTPMPSANIIVENIINLPSPDNQRLDSKDDWTVNQDYDEYNEVVKMNDVPKSRPDSYSHISEEPQPEGEMLVSPDSNDAPEKGGIRTTGDVGSPSGNGGCSVAYWSTKLLMSSIIFILMCH